MAVLVPYFATFFGCAFGSVVPLLNTEILVFGIAAATPSRLGWPLVLLAAAGTMAGKMLLFFAGRGALKLRIRGRQRVDRFIEEVERRKGLTGSLLFVSAASGLPPFYVVTVASGAAGLAVSRFLAVGFAGRFLRFTAVVFAPHLIKDLIR